MITEGYRKVKGKNMKKNLLSVLILALLIVNIVLNAIVMISVTSTNKKTAALIGNIATILNLELENGSEEEGEAVVTMADTATYDIADKLTIPLRVESEESGGDGKQHFLVVSVSLAMNIKDKDYETFGTEEAMKTKEGMIKGEITDAISGYTLTDVQKDGDAVRADILDRLQKMFDSKFIYKVTFRDFIPQ